MFFINVWPGCGGVLLDLMSCMNFVDVSLDDGFFHLNYGIICHSSLVNYGISSFDAMSLVYYLS